MGEFRGGGRWESGHPLENYKGLSEKYLDDSKSCQDSFPPPRQHFLDLPMCKNTYSVCVAVNWGGGGRNPRYFVSWFAHGRKWKENWSRRICDIHYQYTNSMLSVYVVIFPSMMTVLLSKVPRRLKTF